MTNKSEHRGKGKRRPRNFEDAKKFVQELGLQSASEWKRFAESGTKPLDIPAKPSVVYKKTWKGWSDWLGHDDDDQYDFKDIKKIPGIFGSEKERATVYLNLKNTASNLSGYKDALTQWERYHRHFEEVKKKKSTTAVEFDTKLDAKQREELIKKIRGSITKLEGISEKITSSAEISPQEKKSPKKKLTSVEKRNVLKKLEKLEENEDWEEILHMTSSIIPSPATKQIELKKIDIISCELFSYHIESLIQLKKPEEALPYAKTLLRSSPDEMESSAWFALGRIYQELGIYTKAVNAYKTSIQYDPTESVPWYNLACSYANAPELENFDQKACNALLIAIALDDDPQKLILDISDDDDLNPIHHNPRFRKIIDSTSSELF